MAVYYIRGADDLIKIGKADRPEHRLKELQTGSSVELVLLATEPGDLDVERRRHLQFAADRVRLEWFHPSPGLLEHIAAVKAGEQSPLRAQNSPVVPLPEHDWMALWGWGVWLGKGLLKLVAAVLLWGMCMSAVSKPSEAPSAAAPTLVAPPSEVLDVAATPAATPQAWPPTFKPTAKRKVTRHRPRQQRLELPCRPGQKPPCYD